jgi:hypothetical protein
MSLAVYLSDIKPSQVVFLDIGYDGADGTIREVNNASVQPYTL